VKGLKLVYICKSSKVITKRPWGFYANHQVPQFITMHSARKWHWSFAITLQTKLTLLIVKLGKKPLTTTCGTSESFEATKSLMRCCFDPTPCSSRLKLWQLKFSYTKPTVQLGTGEK